MEISFHSRLDSNTVIATKFGTWHDSCVVVACVKICCDLMASNGVKGRRSFHRIWITGKKTLVKRAPGQHKSTHCPLGDLNETWLLSVIIKYNHKVSLLSINISFHNYHYNDHHHLTLLLSSSFSSLVNFQTPCCDWCLRYLLWNCRWVSLDFSDDKSTLVQVKV